MFYIFEHIDTARVISSSGNCHRLFFYNCECMCKYVSSFFFLDREKRDSFLSNVLWHHSDPRHRLGNHQNQSFQWKKEVEFQGKKDEGVSHFFPNNYLYQSLLQKSWNLVPLNLEGKKLPHSIQNDCFQWNFSREGLLLTTCW